MTNEIAHAAKRRDEILRELIRSDNDPNRFEARISQLKQQAHATSDRLKQGRLSSEIRNLEQKQAALEQLRAELIVDYRRASESLNQKISEVENQATQRGLRNTMQERKVQVHLDETDNVKSPQNAQKMRTTVDFMEKHGASPVDVQNFARATDFSRPVEVVTIAPGKSITQRVRSEQKPGHYYSDVGVASERVGVDATNRVHRRFETTGPVTALRSTSAPVMDNFTIRPKRTGVRGGNSQYWIPDSKNVREQHVRILKRKGAANDLVLKNGRGIKVGKVGHKRSGPKL